ncbi:hypothetical protein GTP41_12590 [Pseudoduganella sp. DS3]|uniref:DUF3471 domain-containing protein n=1 Tax=Pseudoduganella guangdongensis TaxID=2692179 RepID=A0A6N9HHW2_9BURK|nr:hypothetical protein [Pseudoduganella guangdongensis]MYN02939.1 hypothetical protein [Pseudoduganella guangdongensis]
MKHSLTAVGLLLVAANAAAQGSAGADQSVVVPAQKAKAEHRLISPQDFYQYQGAYALSNGQTLTLTRGAVRLYAQLGQQARQEIHWYGDGRFTAADGSLTMNIVWLNDDTATGELSFTPRVAGTSPIKTHIAFAAR